MNTATFLLYLTTWTLVAISPGPAVLYVISQATRGGVRGSLAGIAGLQLGSLLFFVALGTGLAALLATMTAVFTALRFIGAVYLGWLGVSLIASSFRKKIANPTQTAQVSVPSVRSFWQGLFIQLTNPKALLFASALLPQFIDSHRPMFGQVALLFVITVVVDLASMFTYATLAARGMRSFRASALSVWLERAFGAALIGFGVRLALTQK